MKRFNYLLGIVFLSFLFTVTSCTDDDDDNDNDTEMEYILTSEMFNSASNAIELNINTGASAHNGTAQTGEDTFRDVYTNMTDVNGAAKPGDVITKFVYGKNENGEKSDLLVAFAMVKQESGFGDDHGNWYWYMLPAENGNPNLSNIALAGNQAMCSGCHAGASNDFRFVFNN